ncbi:adenosine kinase [Swingsia samuiensis]|uniref:Adenosine kinase n=1 Tax=Swingsia samuiensis TaxID=1293412 RepID=A0A4Y6UHY0_9PROT|nr:adenosine kinase [Swingsia samuiensis]QDH16654.1 adenosine kinase [Swingsia samuiensis]
MSVSRFDLLCIGNAIVDVLAHVETSVVAELGVTAGSMTLIDAEMAQKIERHIRIEKISGGGSAANTAVVASKMGAKVAYLGKVADDKTGQQFAEDVRAQGLAFPSSPLSQEQNIPTARCIVLITPDGQRTMFTYLGACTEFTPSDVDKETVESARITYLEGYLYDKPQAQAAFEQAAQFARQAGNKVALTLSDTFCVERHRAAFRALVAGHIDILFANEAEILALYETSDFDSASQQIAKETQLAVLTRAEKGAVVVAGEDRFDVPTQPVKVVDTTGAGDAFAAGFLAGLSKGRDLQKCAQLGNEAAAAIITRVGARPEDDFSLRA